MLRQLNTPVLLIGFNRPDLTQRALEQIRKVKPTRLYFAVDGARSKLESKKVDEVRRVIKTIDWKCQVKTNFQKNNLGCKEGPVAAMNWFFDNEELGIILEDDVLADESFFYFAAELLDKYKDEKKVGSISGNNFQFGVKRGEGDYYFSRYSHSCGWATWRRAWKLYDIKLEDYIEKKELVLEKVFGRWLDKFYWKLIFNGIRSEEIDSAWDYQWNWMMWKYDMLGIIPNQNLVKNIGFGRKDATHTKSGSRFDNMEVMPVKVPLKHPKKIARNRAADDLTSHQNYVLWKEMGMLLIRKWNLINSKIRGLLN